jgi:hypothetical protein
MKTVLEIIAVVVVVFCLIGTCVFLSRTPASDARVAPDGAADEASTTVIIGGAP